MACADIKPKSKSRAKKWSDEIENLYRFQQAGYRDEIEYKQVKQVDMDNMHTQAFEIGGSLARNRICEETSEKGQYFLLLQQAKRM
ncbi:meiosis expressed gene 1 protein homolog isoform X2 [Chelonoidis abingdonii]|uniref:meiosis expressed gene 1 protein homolog isoform X2 n=1 Tax=Chelonoidis abingdonii TaxID=106734 RepID=UPI0013F29D61|nr:meiosis expressed gene 1 protein homolog isoform X2 [Chelonoidis abingdonii]